MSAIALRAGAAVGILRRDFAIFTSYRTTFVSQVFTVVMSVVLFYYISRLVSVGEFSPDAYFAFAVIGLVIVDVLNAALVLVPTTLRQELVAGTFERLVLSPFGAVGSVASMTVFPFLWSVVKGVAVLAIATLAFGLPLNGMESLLAVPVAALGSFSFIPFGLLVAGVVLLIKQALGISAWIASGLAIVAGFYFPVTLLPEWVQWVSEVQPFTPAVELMRYLLVGTEMSSSVSTAVIKLVVFAVVLFPPALWFMAKAVRISRRRGTIIEY